MTQEVKLKRVECGYQAKNSRFLLECDFSKQYHSYYRKRLEKTRPSLKFNCRSKWPSSIPIYTLTQLASICDRNQETVFSPSRDLPSSDDTFRAGTNQISDRICICMGTIFKRMKLQPDVIQELCHGDFHLNCERYKGHYLSLDDELILEDDEESIALTGNINPARFVTGIVVAVLGHPIDECTKFRVKDICYAEPNQLFLYDEDDPEQDEAKPVIARPYDVPDLRPIYLMVISGLEFHQDMRNENLITRALQNVINFVWGGDEYSEDDRSSRVGRILVIGNNLLEDRLSTSGWNRPSQDNQTDDIAIKMKRSRQVKPYSSSIRATKYLDDFFAELSKTINVDVMPGPSDPTTHLMPQQPFHPCMFPKSRIFSSFNCVTNPHRAIYNDNVEILATAGQNIDIIEKFSSIDDPIQIMRHHLLWANSGPSAPDNLYSAPNENEDPMVIDFVPDVYIAGCQEYFQTDVYRYKSSEPSEAFVKPGIVETPDFDVSTTLTECDNPPSSTPETSKCASVNSRSPGRTQSVESRKNSTLLVTVPKFSETFSCILINLKNLDLQLVSFR